MKHLPDSDHTILLRTDFSNDDLWDRVCAAIKQPLTDDQNGLAESLAITAAMGQPIGDVRADVEPVDSREYEGLTTDQLLTLTQGSNQGVVLVIDREAISNPEHPVLVVDVAEEPGRTFRAVPSQIQGIENNLSIANMDWEDFADHVDDDGVFRGLPDA